MNSHFNLDTHASHFSTVQLSLGKIDGLLKCLTLILCIYICMNPHFDLVPIFTGVKPLHKVQCNRKYQAH